MQSPAACRSANIMQSPTRRYKSVAAVVINDVNTISREAHGQATEFLRRMSVTAKETPLQEERTPN
ncbi:hypothetical protein ALC56_10816 [Trachymyrmex septentrionalis]|uniref:Uncharacterized protein n=1 Tax=Trachymyrmex septentrionalis TaxID=34720 RepID=A0A195F309_9HYME|nr:hypothetical protein ALC56_10816 [Trachymyrmex septentrionalis]